MTRSTYYGHELWKDENFGVIAARVWLRVIPENDEHLGLMLQKVAKGEYPRIIERMNEFIGELMRSKQATRDHDLKIFFESITENVLNKIDPNLLSSKALMFLMTNESRKEASVFNPTFELVIAKRNLPPTP